MGYLDTILNNKSIIKPTIDFIGKSIKSENKEFDNFILRVEALGVIIIEPKNRNHENLCLTTTIHGNETKPLKAVDLIFKEIIEEKIKVSRKILIVIGSPLVLKDGSRFIDRNLNRLFNSKEQGEGYEFNRTKELKDIYNRFFKDKKGLLLDLHSAIKEAKYSRFGISPYKQEINYYILEQLGIEAIVRFNQKASSLSSYSYHILGIPCYTLEIDKVEDLSLEYKKESLYYGLVDLIKAPIMSIKTTNIDTFKIYKKVIKESEDHEIFLKDNFKNFDKYNKNEKIASDAIQGNVVLEEDSYVLFPNIKVPIGSRSMLLLRRVESNE